MALGISYQLFSEYFQIDSSIPNGLVWKKFNKNTNTISLNSPSGCLLASGYFQIKFQGKKYYNHRIIYCIHNKIDLTTDLVIDHIDRNKLNNNPINLRLVDYATNIWNSAKPKSNTSGYVNISITGNKYVVKIKSKNKYIHSSFSTLSDAIKFRNDTVFKIRGMYPID